jgi:hypothetical protein
LSQFFSVIVYPSGISSHQATIDLANTNSDSFYENLNSFNNFSGFSHVSNYQQLPPDWLVIITDIKGSTEAIAAGHYKSVNATGAASIVAVLNSIKPLAIPYAFGGDGATFCIPGSKKQAVESALMTTKVMAQTHFDLDLRVGIVPMSTLAKESRQVLVGKYQPSEYFQQAMFSGDGLSYAEMLVKDTNSENRYLLADSVTPGDCCFDGFECRWNEIPSPSEESISILVQAIDDDETNKSKTYDSVFQKILEIYGHESTHHPLREESLKLSLSPAKLSVEARIRTADKPFWTRWLYILKIVFLDIVGSYMMKNQLTTESVEWGKYKTMLISNTDFRKFDELLRMVISGTRAQQAELREYLQKLHQQKKIVYGIHASPKALVTCLVSHHQNEHIHFLDGTKGGYAMAAVELKQQIKQLGI